LGQFWEGIFPFPRASQGKKRRVSNFKRVGALKLFGDPVGLRNYRFGGKPFWEGRETF